EVPANGVLDIEYWDTASQTWQHLAGPYDGTTDPVVNYTIPTGLRDAMGGLRFTFTADPGTAFVPGAAVQPNYTAAMRQDVTTGAPYDPVTYENTYGAEASNGALD